MQKHYAIRMCYLRTYIKISYSIIIISEVELALNFHNLQLIMCT